MEEQQAIYLSNLDNIINSHQREKKISLEHKKKARDMFI